MASQSKVSQDETGLAGRGLRGQAMSVGGLQGCLGRLGVTSGKLGRI